MSELLIYSEATSSRLTFVLGLIFRDLLGIHFKHTTDADVFRKYQGPCLSYAEKPIGDELFIYATDLLFEKGINDQQINVFDWEDTKAFFGTHPRYSFPFDLFAASFFLVSRYEEYLPHLKDEHQRFMPKESLAYQKGFLDKPIVNIWAQKLKKKIAQFYPSYRFPECSFEYISTIDVDSVFSYKDKGIFRTSGALFRSLINMDFKSVLERMQVLFGMKKDPFETFDYQLTLSKRYRLKMIYFFLVGDYDLNDKNIPIRSGAFQNIIKSVADYARVGIHPSYASNTEPDKLKREIARLAKVLNRDVLQSRQHFLKMTFPRTYERLIDMDILEDYTMGYASEIGFRASVCSPFNFYNLDMEQETKLRLFPFMVMDGTLKDNLHLNPKEAIERTRQLADEVKKVKGMFISLWHNHTLEDAGDWAGWRAVYEDTVQYCSSLSELKR